MRSDTPHRVEIGERRWPTTPVLATGLRRANGGDGHGRAAPGLPNGAGMGYRLMILYKPSPKVGKNPRILSNHSHLRCLFPVPCKPCHDLVYILGAFSRL